MLKKISLRLRLTILSIALLTVCCVFLTVILNLSANQMANVIEAIPISPAMEIGSHIEPIEQLSSAASTTEPAQPFDGSQSARQRFLYQSIAAMILVVALGGGLTYYMARKALNPLYELSEQMKKRTVDNLSESLPLPESHDEIADLTVSFNEMSGKLNEAFATQKRFSQSAAHELRTPLTVLKTKVDVFRKKAEHTADEYDKLLNVITTHTNRLSVLVKDLLDLTNIDALDCRDQIELPSLLKAVSEELSLLAQEKNIAVTVEGSGESIIGNKNMLHRAFYNLMENAIKYNVENGKIKINISEGGEHTVVTLCDTGIGIPTDMQEHIFEPFFRVDKSRSRQMGGAGLGLATVKSIIDKHDGTITVSNNPDGGTSFEITI